MSTTYCEIKGTGRHRDRVLTLSTFQGPHPFGPMLQITQGFGTVIGPDEPGFIQLSTLDAYRVIRSLADWLKSEHKRRAQDLQTYIDQNRELQKSIFSEAVACERFIAELQILEIPLTLLEAAHDDQ